ncbi:DUF2884 family protein [Flocculibacter collagenilyticus]|uniref:DUF2884 family protein n=1 Tax=Flocculibacter collagenilyticus TaxID=2744479 RepID=UPI0018F60D70|nr:DUF2884 family protein [Flocculibacter collagenilyticus]
MKALTKFNSVHKSILVASSLMMTSYVAAHQECNINIQQDLKINQGAVEVSDARHKVVFASDQSLMVDGKYVQLNSHQQSLVSEYAQGVRQSIPEMAYIAIDGVELAMDAVNKALGAVLGEGHDAIGEMNGQLHNVKTTISSHFLDSDTVVLKHSDYKDNQIFGPEFERKIEESLESAVKSAMGTLLIHVGQELVMNGGDLSEFEQRMEKMGEDMEQMIEHRAESLEVRADAFCEKVKKLDHLEFKLQTEIPELNHFDLITMESDHDDKRSKREM